MPKLPVVSADETIKALERLGYRTVRQKGSHIRLQFRDSTRSPLTVPDHRRMGRGLLRKILRDAKISVKEFVDLLNN